MINFLSKGELIIFIKTKIKMASDINSKLINFSSINLTQLNATSSFLKRIDRKYLVTIEQLKNILKDLKNDFQVLEINEKRVFSYDNVYMDTPDYLFYNQHQNKEKSRTKIRTRLYKDSDLAFFEYKQKEDWITKKFRYQFHCEEHGEMTKGKKRFFEWVWQSMYFGEKAPKITPAIRTNYNRLTLVSKRGEERLTIDFNIETSDLRNLKSKKTKLENLVIIESKSMSKKCFSSDIMKAHHINEASSCSKYSLWVVYSGLAEKWSTFKKTMKKIKEIRIETTKNRTRKTSLKKVTKNIEHNFKKTSLETI